MKKSLLSIVILMGVAGAWWMWPTTSPQRHTPTQTEPALVEIETLGRQTQDRARSSFPKAISEHSQILGITLDTTNQILTVRLSTPEERLETEREAIEQALLPTQAGPQTLEGMCQSRVFEEPYLQIFEFVEGESEQPHTNIRARRFLCETP